MLSPQRGVEQSREPWAGSGAQGGRVAALPAEARWPQSLTPAFYRVLRLSTFCKPLGGSFGCLLCTYFKDNHILKRKMGK